MTHNDELRALRVLRDTVANDAHAITFQSLGQYRTSLLRELDAMLRDAALASPAAAPRVDWREAFVSACASLARIAVELGIDDDHDDGIEPIMERIAALKAAALQSAAPQAQVVVDLWGWHDGSATFITADEKARRLAQGDAFAKGYTIPFARITPQTGGPA
jgi:hypothetical protein